METSNFRLGTLLCLKAYNHPGYESDECVPQSIQPNQLYIGSLVGYYIYNMEAPTLLAIEEPHGILVNVIARIEVNMVSWRRVAGVPRTQVEYKVLELIDQPVSNVLACAIGYCESLSQLEQELPSSLKF